MGLIHTVYLDKWNSEQTELGLIWRQESKKLVSSKNLYGLGLCYSRAVRIIQSVKKLAKTLDNISVTKLITKLNC